MCSRIRDAVFSVISSGLSFAEDSFLLPGGWGDVGQAFRRREEVPICLGDGNQSYTHLRGYAALNGAGQRLEIVKEPASAEIDTL